MGAGHKPAACLWHLTKHAVADHYRRGGRETPTSHDVLAEAAEAGPPVSPTDIQEIAACLGPLVNTQSLQDRQALQLVDISGGSQSAAAEQLGISRSGMESRVQRARARLSERLLACEITREQLYRQLHDELPYDSAVRPESYTQRKDGSVEIHQPIVVARDSQKGIIIGKGGGALRQLGTEARKAIEKFVNNKVFLDLKVKVDEDWRGDERKLRGYGY